MACQLYLCSFHPFYFIWSISKKVKIQIIIHSNSSKFFMFWNGAQSTFALLGITIRGSKISTLKALFIHHGLHGSVQFLDFGSVIHFTKDIRYKISKIEGQRVLRQKIFRRADPLVLLVCGRITN